MVTDARIFLSSSTSAMLAMIPAPISTEQYRAATGKAKPSCRKRRAARDSRGRNPCPDCQMNSTLRISYERAPPGVVTSTVSPLPLPIRARAIGDDSEILPCLASLSTSPTIWYLRFSSVSSSTNVTVAPNLTVLPESFETSITSARPIWSSSSRTRPSMKPWRSFAAWYSAFSERSPCARASAIALMISWRSTFLRWFTSSSSDLNPAAVMGIRSMAFNSCHQQSCSVRPRLAVWPGADCCGIFLKYLLRLDFLCPFTGRWLRRVRLEGGDFKGARLQSGDRLSCRRRAGDGRVVGHLQCQGGAADREGVHQRDGTFRRVEHEMDLAVLERVDHMRPTFHDLVDEADGNVRSFESKSGAASRDQFEPHADQLARRRDHFGLVGIFDGNEDVARERQLQPGADLALGKGTAKVSVETHDFAGRTHFGTENSVDAWKPRKRHHGLFDGNMRRERRRQRKRLQQFSGHHTRGNRSDRQPDGFGYERHGSAGARIDLEDVNVFALNRKLHVHQAANFQSFGERDRLAFDFFDRRWLQRMGRNCAGGVAGVHAGFLDVLHDARDEHVLGAIADRIDVDLDGVMQKAVDQDRIVAGNAKEFAGLDLRNQMRFIGTHHHAASTQYVRRTQDHGITDLARRSDRLFGGHRRGVARLLEPKFIEQPLKTFAVLRQIDGIGAGAQDRHAFRDEHVGEFERRLSSELNDDAGQDPSRLFDAHHFQNVLRGQRLEIKSIGGVVVG